MPPFSYILLFILVYIFFKNRTSSLKNIIKELFAVNLILELNLFYGYFFKLGTFELSYKAITMLLLFCVISVYVFSFRGLDKSVLFYGLLFVFFNFFGLIYAIFNPYSEPIVTELAGWDKLFFKGEGARSYIEITFSNFYSLLKCMYYVLVLSVIKKLFNTINLWIELISKILFYSTITIAYGYLEFMLKNFLKINTSQAFLTPLFGLREATYNNLALRGHFYMLQGFFTETSFFTLALFLIILLNIAYIYLVKSNSVGIGCKPEKYRIIASTILVFLSFSFSVLVFLGTFINIYLLAIPGKLNKNTLIRLLFVILFIVLTIISFNLNTGIDYYFSRFELLQKSIAQIIQNTIDIHNHTSEMARLTSIITGIKYFMERPLLGLGIGTTDCHATLISLLSTCGILGLFFWGKTISTFAGIKKNGIVFLIAICPMMLCTGNYSQTTNFIYPLLLLVYNKIL